jgi:hypothetical protein
MAAIGARAPIAKIAKEAGITCLVGDRQMKNGVTLPADAVIAALRSGACLRISGAGLAPNVLQSYASAAKDGRSHVTIVMGDGVLLNHVMQAIGAAGRGHVTFDFVSAP